MLAAVGKATSARIALLAIDVRLYTATVPHLNIRYSFAKF
jgi:hypothetical protein